MNTIPEELQKSFDEARDNLFQARTAWAKMTKIEKENIEYYITHSTLPPYDPYEEQEELFIHSLGQVFKRVLEIYEYHAEPQNAREGYDALMTLINHALK